ncbi:MAG: alpha/beta fold hydrolase [archaeon]|nr:alpha/beta fold hydrolase [archaeon]
MSVDIPEDQKISYEALWKAIIRPPRDEYSEIELGEPEFTFKNKVYVRKDYKVLSSQGYLMKCSMLEPREDYRPSFEMPLVIYLHGNSSSRLEGWRMRQLLMNLNINLFVFDFPGSGLSEGEYISLGYHEQNDIKVILDFVEKIPGVGKICLWGRSMGAATTLLYSHRDERVVCAIMDSPFADFSRLAAEMALSFIKVPKFLITVALAVVNKTIQGKNGMNVNELKPIDAAEKTMTPGLFIHAYGDQLINFKHSVDITEKYLGEKSLVSCPGGHNTPRPRSVLNKIQFFLAKHLLGYNLNEKEEKKIDERKMQSKELEEENDEEEEGEKEKE